ncbi:glycosyltransferase family 4 protein [Sphingomicrobium astaxanthinifaciens]|uniref:glycosyltransferase family 4 protein n=1 Tax=Sphingomicrobium astaxanthinifaciens TaxID=1227949 RepID=UPI001FCBB243|nr:glycosyltransferase family 4 protein [Sphingomicrobium astaxanthinifaciens]MCJ7420528.1 glycosyltransferase family 4 protein [Sphingomicrobium astaxanthinifaciens]
MRIALVAPLAESIPPRLYGGTERVVAWLADALVDRGLDVTLFASGDSCTKAELHPCAEEGLRLKNIDDHLPHMFCMFDKVRERVDEFDILHFHTDFFHFPVFQPYVERCFTTLHGRLDLPDTFCAYEHFDRMRLVSISDDQRRPMPNANFSRTIYHGMPADLLPYSPQSGDYLAFLGRISPEKRPDRAIEIAKRAGRKLRIAAKVDNADRDYFEREIKPMLDHPLIEFIGEIDDREKAEFLGGAIALLFPIDWPEPFGLVMIEAMATGTPVIGWRNGSTPEVIRDGRSGLLVKTIEEAVEAVEKCASLSRSKVRESFDQRFTADIMAANYADLFRGALVETTSPSVEGQSLLFR